jgi:hypothetical protein
MSANAGYVIAGYALTVLALGGYVLRLFARSRSARRRAEAVAARRTSG